MARSICFVGLDNLPALAPELNISAGGGGEALQQTMLAKALTRRGYTVSMVVTDFGQADGATWDGITTFKTCRSNAGLPVLRFVHPRMTTLWTALRRADAEVYYVSCAGVTLWQVAMFARMHGRKVVFRIASDSDCDPKKLLIQFWRDKELYRRGLRRANQVLAQTPIQQDLLVRNYAKPSVLAPMLADLGGRCLSFEQRDLQVLWVSNLRQVKRPDLFIDMARALPHVEFHMIGGPLAEDLPLYEKIEREARRVGNLHFLGQIPYHEINAYFERARVFVNTSDVEGFPNTFLQAWSRGTPVVTFLDPAQLVAKHGMGHAAKALHDMRDFTAAFATDSAIWSPASASCRAFMAREFDETVVMRAYLDALDAMYDAPRAPC
jgi:glycosyltransferase involved in cell wall biosynthesis